MSTIKKADLHIHTTFSDGTYQPEEAVEAAISAGVSAIAVTDHDITEGIERALKAGARYGIEVIPGIELSCEYNGTEIHMLGFYINWENNWFQGKLKVFQRARERRAIHILNKLKKIGVDIDEQMLFSYAGEGSISRIHFARCLVNSGIVSDTQEAFRKYLEQGRPAFVKKLRVTPDEAISMIQRVGGLPVVAHPVYGGGHKSFLRKLKKQGLCGIEAYHPGQDARQSGKLAGFASDLGLLVTGGSDSHGSRPDENPIGSIDVDYNSVEKLKAEKIDRERKNRHIMVC